MNLYLSENYAVAANSLYEAIGIIFQKSTYVRPTLSFIDFSNEVGSLKNVDKEELVEMLLPEDEVSTMKRAGDWIDHIKTTAYPPIINNLTL